MYESHNITVNHQSLSVVHSKNISGTKTAPLGHRLTVRKTGPLGAPFWWHFPKGHRFPIHFAKGRRFPKWCPKGAVSVPPFFLVWVGTDIVASKLSGVSVLY